jgi:lipoate-protein ligase A
LRFRFLVDDPGDGALNMAVDEALFLSAGGPLGVATVRLYGFLPPTVSLGYRQAPEEAIDLERCRELGVDCVKRPTGGRALLHQHELTYCVASPLDGTFRGAGVRAVYDAVSTAIRRALSRIGIPLDPVASEGERDPEPALRVPCLGIPGRHEIASGGRKVVASAQRRGRRAFLQHGSILRRVDSALWAKLAPRNAPGTPLQAVGIDELLPRPISQAMLVSALLESFQELFGTAAELRGLTPAERSEAAALRERYRSALTTWKPFGKKDLASQPPIVRSAGIRLHPPWTPG